MTNLRDGPGLGLESRDARPEELRWLSLSGVIKMTGSEESLPDIAK